MKLWFLMAFLLITNILVPSLQADAPGEMNYQGKLTDPAGNPLTGTYSMQFRICDAPAPSGDCSLYDQTHPSVSVTNGVFQVTVGTLPMTAIPPSVFQGGVDRYLLVSVGAQGAGLLTDLLPRQKLLAAPYALAVATNSVGTNEIVDSSVNSTKIVDGAVSLIDLNTTSLSGMFLTTGTVQSISGQKTFLGGALFPNSGIWNTSGFVGIGTNPSTAELDVLGNIRIQGTAAALPPCDGTRRGVLYFLQGTTDKLYICMQKGTGGYQWVLAAIGE